MPQAKCDVCIIIPTLNEAQSIGRVISSLPKRVDGKAVNVLVVDGHSCDGTVEAAREAGAEVLLQRSIGKGAAMKEAVQMMNAEVYGFIDGDGTYDGNEFECIIGPILRNEADMVVGSRFLGKMEKGAVTRLNKVGNRLFNMMIMYALRQRFSDILSGYRAIKGEALRQLVLFSDGFEIEIEMTVEAIIRKLRIAEVPIAYSKRRGAPSKLRPVDDGARMARAVLFLVMNTRPLLFFSIFATLFFLIGAYPTSLVLYEKISTGEVLHIPSVVLASLLLTIGILVVFFGLLAELMVNMRRRLEHTIDAYGRRAEQGRAE